MGTQKNRLNETVLLSTQNMFFRAHKTYMLKIMGKKIFTILRSHFLFYVKTCARQIGNLTDCTSEVASSKPGLAIYSHRNYCVPTLVSRRAVVTVTE